jgi:hydroxypyruvate reductase
MKPSAIREQLMAFLEAALAAVDPEPLTRDALTGTDQGPTTLVAIGKAAAAMCRGAGQALDDIDGICVSDADDDVPHGVDLMVGDHPLPGERSLAAGHKVLERASRSRGRLIALISGGGSALCERAIAGVDEGFITSASQALLTQGAPIGDINLIRRHLSSLKGGGLARAANVPVETYAISDVSGADPALIASGPTVTTRRDPGLAITMMQTYGIEVPESVAVALWKVPDEPIAPSQIEVLADGRTAAEGLARRAGEAGVPARIVDWWLEGPVTDALDRLLAESGPGITIATGEPVVEVDGDGIGGRNTHAALLAATHLEGEDALFAALATDGTDGNSQSAGAIVDGSTLSRGGDPSGQLANSDSAGYLAQTGDLVVTGRTGTNVSDLWVLWR